MTQICNLASDSLWLHEIAYYAWRVLSKTQSLQKKVSGK